MGELLGKVPKVGGAREGEKVCETPSLSKRSRERRGETVDPWSVQLAGSGDNSCKYI